MTYNSAIALDQLTESQAEKAPTANEIFAALSGAALFGIKASATSGLNFTVYGGNMYIAGVPTAIATQTVVLSANATNYIYATSSGVVTKTTSLPSGWPGPLAAGAIALYKLVTGASTITEATSVNYLLGVGPKGDTGAAGAQGPAGSDLSASRKRILTTVGNSSLVAHVSGWEVSAPSTTATARSLASGSLRTSIPYTAYLGAAGAGSSAQVYSTRTFSYTGDAAGRGGFVLSMRFCLESAVSPANCRSFFGLFVPAVIGNVEPDTFTNIVGIGSKAGEANLSLLYNDASGTATKTLITSVDSPSVNFPARATDNVYELTLTSVANSQSVTWRLDNLNDGTHGTGVINSNIPSNSTFLSWTAWVNNGSTASAAAFGLMQVIGETRY